MVYSATFQELVDLRQSMTAAQTLLTRHVQLLREIALLRESGDCDDDEKRQKIELLQQEINEQGPSVVREIQRMLRNAIYRRGLTAHEPRHVLGVHAKTWTEAVDSMTGDCYFYVFSRDKNGRLSDAIKKFGNIDRMLWVNVKHFVHEAQGKPQPYRERLWKKGICRVIKDLVEQGPVSVSTEKLQQKSRVTPSTTTATNRLLKPEDLRDHFARWQTNAELVSGLSKVKITKDTRKALSQYIVHLLENGDFLIGDLYDSLCGEVSQAERNRRALRDIVAIGLDEGESSSKSVKLEVVDTPFDTLELADFWQQILNQASNGDTQRRLVLNYVREIFLLYGRLNQKALAELVKANHPEIPLRRLVPQRISEDIQKLKSAILKEIGLV